jgi:hypothetical protein
MDAGNAERGRVGSDSGAVMKTRWAAGSDCYAALIEECSERLLGSAERFESSPPYWLYAMGPDGEMLRAGSAADLEEARGKILDSCSGGIDLPSRERIAELEAELEEWRDYWGCSSPHDTHVQSGERGEYARQLGIEQARANRVENAVRRLQRILNPACRAIEEFLWINRSEESTASRDETRLRESADDEIQPVQQQEKER